MDKNLNKQLCAGLVVLGAVIVEFGNILMGVKFTFNPVREGGTLLLVVWLLTGSCIARWIVGILSGLAFLLAMTIPLWVIYVESNPVELFMSRWQSFSLIILSGLIYGFVCWRLLLWRDTSRSNILKRQSNKQEVD